MQIEEIPREQIEFQEPPTGHGASELLDKALNKRDTVVELVFEDKTTEEVKIKFGGFQKVGEKDYNYIKTDSGQKYFLGEKPEGAEENVVTDIDDKKSG